MINYAKETIKLKCAICSLEIPIRIEQIINHESFPCPGCNDMINLVDEGGGFKKAVEELNRSALN